MIQQLSLHNFKAFDELMLDLTKLTILSGCNNSGKSSVIQAIRLLDKQAPLDDLGALRDFIRNNNLEFRISCVEGENRLVEFSSDRRGESKSNGNRIKSLISYISAGRFGPLSSLKFGINGEIDTVGAYGERLIDFLYQLDTSFMGLRVPYPLIIKGGVGVRSNLQEWLRLISPNVEFDFNVEKGANLGWTEFDHHKSIHAGFGLSYVLPLILSVLVHAAQTASQENPRPVVLLVENPEAHLHPAGQTMMGRLLALGAACGLQIIAETHSDHLLNGIRMAVKEKCLDATAAAIFYFRTVFSDTLIDDPSYTAIDKLYIDEYGMINNWPEGFFDETEKSLLKLI